MECFIILILCLFYSSADITVLKKLLLFSLGMFVFPIGTFFLLQKTLPKGIGYDARGIRIKSSVKY